MSKPAYSIKSAAHRTGLSPHVIRIWEKRYGAVKPNRTATNRRMYSEEELVRLSLLRQVCCAGHSIGAIAQLSVEQLRQMLPLAQDALGEGAMISLREARLQSTRGDPFLARCLTAIRELDAHQLEEGLSQAAVALGSQGLLRRVVCPLTHAVGDLWRQGDITAAHEHFASAVIRVFLGQILKPYALGHGAPRLVVATPVGQLHELGAVIAGAAAASLGWQVTYLGTSLPAVEIAGVAVQNKARAVALSIVYPEDDIRVNQEIRHLGSLLPRETRLIVGGRAAPSYRAMLERVQAIVCEDLEVFSVALDRLRRPAADA